MLLFIDKQKPKIANASRCGIDRIEGEEYLGATGLHLAIAYGNDEIASIIIEAKGLNINERALGTFFLPRDQERHSVREILFLLALY